LLADAGITVGGNAVVRAIADDGMATLASISGDSLGEMLIPMLAYSNNYMADTLTLDVATTRGYSAPLRLARASQPLQQLAATALAQSYPERAAQVTAPKLTSGSGLSVSNKLSARHLVSLLNHMYRQPA